MQLQQILEGWYGSSGHRVFFAFPWTLSLNKSVRRVHKKKVSSHGAIAYSSLLASSLCPLPPDRISPRFNAPPVGDRAAVKEAEPSPILPCSPPLFVPLPLDRTSPRFNAPLAGESAAM